MWIRESLDAGEEYFLNDKTGKISWIQPADYVESQRIDDEPSVLQPPPPPRKRKQQHLKAASDTVSPTQQVYMAAPIDYTKTVRDATSIKTTETVETSFNTKPSFPLILVIAKSDLFQRGSLLVVDHRGTQFGRDNAPNRLPMVELAVSRFHCVIYFRTKFFIADCASTHGTFVNGRRLSEAKKASIPRELRHNDIIQIGSTFMQVHHHSSCQHCDLKSNLILKISGRIEKPVRLSKRTLEQMRIDEIRRIKADYGLEEESDEELNHERKLKIRKQALEITNKLAKRNVALNVISAPIDPSNKGRQLLEKMGWKQGSGLGVKPGIVEPIVPSKNLGKKGLGS